MSTYSYSLDAVHLRRLQEAFVRQGQKLRLYDGKVVNLDFHTVPHYGEESELERHWAGARGKVMQGALTLFAQDAESKLMLYSAADSPRAARERDQGRVTRLGNKPGNHNPWNPQGSVSVETPLPVRPIVPIIQWRSAWE